MRDISVDALLPEGRERLELGSSGWLDVGKNSRQPILFDFMTKLRQWAILLPPSETGEACDLVELRRQTRGPLLVLAEEGGL